MLLQPKFYLLSKRASIPSKGRFWKPSMGSVNGIQKEGNEGIKRWRAISSRNELRWSLDRRIRHSLSRLCVCHISCLSVDSQLIERETSFDVAPLWLYDLISLNMLSRDSLSPFEYALDFLFLLQLCIKHLFDTAQKPLPLQRSKNSFYLGRKKGLSNHFRWLFVLVLCLLCQIGRQADRHRPTVTRCAFICCCMLIPKLHLLGPLFVYRLR